MHAVILAGSMVMKMKMLNELSDIFSNDQPKICVPLTPMDETDLKRQLEKIHQQSADIDLIEWRADYWQGDLEEGLEMVSKHLQNFHKPLLFTIRTAEEGGEKDVPSAEYERLIRMSGKYSCFMMYDLQLALVKQSGGALRVLMDDLHKAKKRIILSYHDFHATPSDEQMLAILKEEESLGADLVKLAVMPQTETDCDRLMQVSKTFTQIHKTPAITISMGELGVKSRIQVRESGSCITFASASASSAPGQLPASRLRKLLQTQ